jgi:cell division protein FtsB
MNTKKSILTIVTILLMSAIQFTAVWHKSV